VDGKPAPRVPEPLFPVLRKLGAADVQKARAWLLAWLLDRLGQRVQEPLPPAYHIQREISGEWMDVVGPFYRERAALQTARELAEFNYRFRYRVIGAGTTIDINGASLSLEERPHGE
jgi:hypothetical protein